MNAEDLERLEKAAEVVIAKRRGFLLTRRPADDPVFRLWGRWCDRERFPDVYARIMGQRAHVRLDMAPAGKPLSEAALQQAIVLLFGEETLAIHRRLLRRRRGHGLTAAEIDAYYRRVGNGRPVMLLHARRVPAERAETVAAQLLRLARASLAGDESVH